MDINNEMNHIEITNQMKYNIAKYYKINTEDIIDVEACIYEDEDEHGDIEKRVELDFSYINEYYDETDEECDEDECEEYNDDYTLEDFKRLFIDGEKI